MKLLILFSILLSLNSIAFCDDVWFVQPTLGQPIEKQMTIQVYPPYNGTAKVRVKIKSESGWERTVWRGTLSPKNNYTTTIDTSKFRPGPYEIKADYWIGLEHFDGDMDFWIYNPNMPYPQNL